MGKTRYLHAQHHVPRNTTRLNVPKRKFVCHKVVAFLQRENLRKFSRISKARLKTPDFYRAYTKHNSLIDTTYTSRRYRLTDRYMKIPCKSDYELVPAETLKISIKNKYCNCLGESIGEFPLPQTIQHMYNY
jgi:hypothetical protein